MQPGDRHRAAGSAARPRPRCGASRSVGPGRMRRPTNGSGDGDRQTSAAVAGAAGAKRRRPGTTSSPGQTGIWAARRATSPDPGGRSPARAPTSATFAPARAATGSPAAATLVADPAATGPGARRRDRRRRLAADEGADRVPCRRSSCSRTSPPRSSRRRARPIHERNEEIIIKKLASFGITAPDRRPQRRARS